MGNTTKAFDDCMIPLLEATNLNTTRFCINHYNFMKIWVGKMSPEFVDYHIQKYKCLK